MSKAKEMNELLDNIRQSQVDEIISLIKASGGDVVTIAPMIYDLCLTEWRRGYVDGIEVLNPKGNDEFYENLKKKLI
jgi:hypothetical protein